MTETELLRESAVVYDATAQRFEVRAAWGAWEVLRDGHLECPGPDGDQLAAALAAKRAQRVKEMS